MDLFNHFFIFFKLEVFLKFKFKSITATTLIFIKFIIKVSFNLLNLVIIVTIVAILYNPYMDKVNIAFI